MKLTKRMEAGLAEIRRQMDANVEMAGRRAQSAQTARDEGRPTMAVRDYARAAGAYHMACAYAIALQAAYRGLQGEDAWPVLDELGAKQGRYATAAGNCEQDLEEAMRALYRGSE